MFPASDFDTFLATLDATTSRHPLAGVPDPDGVDFEEVHLASAVDQHGNRWSRWAVYDNAFYAIRVDVYGPDGGLLRREWRSERCVDNGDLDWNGKGGSAPIPCPGKWPCL